MVDEELLKILACPKCKKELIYNRERDVLICENCQVFYPIEDGIPILLTDASKPLEELR
ncbi:MAG: Trm112 family protein [Hydrogenobacter thermophilus]|uniref:Trm112 family protein n=1 Tax=Hydrogenobacter thermophilus TaxID=940 RepID=UPI001C784330|nr:Trm112 family protein [Hydrogenobacter thermophilus]QWK20487.1 MAG: Trm112 family protein [Hydrogenobacter thermophilus]